MRYVMGRNDQAFRAPLGAGGGQAADASPEALKAAAADRVLLEARGIGGELSVQGLSILKPPYGVITAINLDRGDIQWQVPAGETPDNVRRNPALKGLNIGNTGQPGSAGVLVTKTLLIVGDNMVTSVTHPRGAMLRAYDKATGKEVGAVWMPAPQSGCPMTYMWQGRQYIVIAVSGGTYSGEYIAFALPDAE
jgi:quinoprotein glucose dehydrogenase